MIIWGVNADNHDASLAVVSDNEVLFAGHAERYSRVKNDPNLNDQLIRDALEYGSPDQICWYERPIGRAMRHVKAGQWGELFRDSPADLMKPYTKAPIAYGDHHKSHAAAGFYTSGFDEACVLVVDAIGELITTSIWQASHEGLKRLWCERYPCSLGLFYSAMTHLVGLKPNEEEYILMGMAGYGKLNHELFKRCKADIASGFNFHRGVRKRYVGYDPYDIACVAQAVITDELKALITRARQMSASENLVYGGGVALNCVANTELIKLDLFKRLWILPNPGDAGSAIGAVTAYTGKHVKLDHVFLGHDIKTEFDVDQVVDELLTVGIVGVANGRAEFGPRAFGNRSLLADPRAQHMKDRVNQIKQRQEFRPFAPAVLAEDAHDLFDLPVARSPFMQYTCDVKVDWLPAITHVDGTARVQTVDENSKNMRAVLLRWRERTGCPVLLNTSLNIKGEPLVNTASDGARFADKYGVKVL